MPQSIRARSWLFVPGDHEHRMAKAVASDADVVIFDLEDAVASANKPQARARVYDFLKAHRKADEGGGVRLWVRINPFDGPYTLHDLAAIMPARPGGIMLPKVTGRADVDKLDHCLSSLEVAFGIEEGSTKVILLVTETAGSMFHTGDYAGAARVVAMSWGAEDLADAIGASRNTNDDGAYSFTYQLARSLCLLGAAHAGVTPIETISGDYRDLEALARRAEAVRREGFRGMLAIHPAQVPVINAAFTPSADEIAEAQEIVAIFAANPGVGVLGYRGTMLDRPHVARAETLLRWAGVPVS